MTIQLILAAALAGFLEVQPVGVAAPALADVRAVNVPDDDAERGLQWSSTRDEYKAARADMNFVFEQFSYESDDLVVGAYLYRPKATGPELSRDCVQPGQLHASQRLGGRDAGHGESFCTSRVSRGCPALS